MHPRTDPAPAVMAVEIERLASVSPTLEDEDHMVIVEVAIEADSHANRKRKCRQLVWDSRDESERRRRRWW